MYKEQEKGLLNQKIAEIPNLRAFSLKSREFTTWYNEALKLLESIYGKDSAEYRRFVNAPGRIFTVGTELGQEQNYNFRLDRYDAVLKSLVEGE